MLTARWRLVAVVGVVGLVAAEPARPDWHKVMAEKAKAISNRFEGETYAGRVSFEGVGLWSQRRMRAEAALRANWTDAIPVAQAHVERMRFLQRYVRHLALRGRMDVLPDVTADYLLADAEDALARSRRVPYTQTPDVPTVTASAAAAWMADNVGWEKWPDGVRRPRHFRAEYAVAEAELRLERLVNEQGPE
jgi:hypothetical protein